MRYANGIKIGLMPALYPDGARKLSGKDVTFVRKQHNAAVSVDHFTEERRGNQWQILTR